MYILGFKSSGNEDICVVESAISEMKFFVFMLLLGY